MTTKHAQNRHFNVMLGNPDFQPFIEFSTWKKTRRLLGR